VTVRGSLRVSSRFVLSRCSMLQPCLPKDRREPFESADGPRHVPLAIQIFPGWETCLCQTSLPPAVHHPRGGRKRFSRLTISAPPHRADVASLGKEGIRRAYFGGRFVPGSPDLSAEKKHWVVRAVPSSSTRLRGARSSSTSSSFLDSLDVRRDCRPNLLLAPCAIRPLSHRSVRLGGAVLGDDTSGAVVGSAAPSRNRRSCDFRSRRTLS